jgi:peptidoglycan hydrolase-like protein with peptidoglycan-binding domain
MSPDPTPDPYPSWPLLKQGVKGSNVKLWQGALVKGGFLPNVASSTDGAFGALTTAATKLLQKKGNLTADGVVGPNARKAARSLGLW